MRNADTMDFKLNPGDLLYRCTKGFTWNDVQHTGSHTPYEVRVVKEYPKFVEVEASFTDNGGKKYRECINKYAVIAGDCHFKKWKGE